MADLKLNCLGMKCPMPVVKTKNSLKDLKPGQILEVLADDKGAKSDLPALLKKIGGYTLVEMKEEGPKIIFTIKKD